MRVDEQTGGEVAEGDVADQTVDEGLERLPAVQGGGLHASKRHIDVGDLEHIPAADLERSRHHLAHRGARGPGGPDEGADARSHDERRPKAALFEGAEDADVGQPLEAATAQNQCKRSFFVHVLPHLQVGGVLLGPSRNCKNRAPP